MTLINMFSILWQFQKGPWKLFCDDVLGSYHYLWPQGTWKDEHNVYYAWNVAWTKTTFIYSFLFVLG
jgi:hypothetical protein